MRPEELDRQEVYRYLGYRNDPPDERVTERVEQVIEGLLPALTPKVAVREFPLTMSPAKNRPELSFAGVTVRSRALSRHLRGCSAVLLMALTVGPEPDREIRRAEIDRITDAVILQAVAAAAVEQEADRLNEAWQKDYEARGFLLKPRFSPGYGDFDLAYQKDIIRILNTPKTIGLTLTEGLLMIPSKSITALIGIYRNENGEDHEKHT